MDLILTASQLHGTVRAIPSKSEAHRLLICAALAAHPAAIACARISYDIEATVACLRAMGAEISWEQGVFSVTPICPVRHDVLLPCRESGSTLRFLLPVCGALGLSGCFRMEGRLPQRPMNPLIGVLTAHGMEIRQEGECLFFRGQLTGGDYAIAGNVSSQYLTGLLLALPLLPQASALRLTTALESRPYLDLTLAILTQCGVTILEKEDSFCISAPQRPSLPHRIAVCGDWSDAAVFLAAGAIAGPVTVCGLQPDSMQGDRAIVGLLESFGAGSTTVGNAVTVFPAPLRGITIEAAEIPDLVPVLAAVAAAAEGNTVIRGAARLRFKESDRLRALCGLLRSLGGSAEETEDGLVIHGCGHLSGGTPDLCGDHRIAMAAALCSLICEREVILHGAQCTEKSHPDFWADFAALRKEP